MQRRHLFELRQLWHLLAVCGWIVRAIRQCDLMPHLPGRQLDGRSWRIHVCVVRGQFLLQHGAGAVHLVSRQLDLVCGLER
jgi:hypothetical protein